MKLQELLKDVAVLSNTADGAAEINEVRYDSRAVQKGDLFVAIRGYATDGHKYIAKALEPGRGGGGSARRRPRAFPQSLSKIRASRSRRSRRTASAIRRTAW